MNWRKLYIRIKYKTKIKNTVTKIKCGPNISVANQKFVSTAAGDDGLTRGMKKAQRNNPRKSHSGEVAKEDAKI